MFASFLCKKKINKVANVNKSSKLMKKNYLMKVIKKICKILKNRVIVMKLKKTKMNSEKWMQKNKKKIKDKKFKLLKTSNQKIKFNIKILKKKTILTKNQINYK